MEIVSVVGLGTERVLALGATRGTHVKMLLIHVMQDTRQVVTIAIHAPQGKVASQVALVKNVKRESIQTVSLPQNAIGA